MSRVVRVIPLGLVLMSFTVCGWMLWFAHDAVGWLHIGLLAAAYAVLSGPNGRPATRAMRSFLTGLAVSVVLVAIALGVGWVADRRHFFDDGGPIAGALVIEAYIGLPSAFLAAFFGALAPRLTRAVVKLRTRQAV